MTPREPPDYLDAPEREGGHQVAHLRIPPHSIEAESSVLGGLLLDNRSWDLVADLLTESDFYADANRQLFGVIGSLVNSGKPADVITVFEELQRRELGERTGGLPYVNSLAQFMVGSANVRRYAEIVRENAKRRQLVHAADQIATAAFSLQGRTVEALLDEAAQMVMAISSEAVAEEWEALGDSVVREIDRISDAANGNDDNSRNVIATGQDHLDDVLDGGMRGGNLIVIGARPGHGKTALADTIGHYVAGSLGLEVGKFSMEMQNQEGAQRAIASIGSIPLHALRRPQRMSDLHWSSLTSAVERLRHYPFYSNDRSGLNINQLRSKARALRRRRGLRLLLVDYFQLMSGTDPRLNRAAQLEEASRGLKSLAKELDIPVVVLAQVKRDVEKAADPMPTMSDLKDCGSLEQDADVILFLHRPKVHQPLLGDEWKHYAEGYVAKQRGGRTRRGLHFDFDGQFTRYQPWPQGVPIPTSKVLTTSSNSGSFE